MYLETNTHAEAVRSLEFAAIQAKTIANDLYAWKWVLISLHNAAQSIMVLAMWNGNGLLSMSEKDAQKWLIAYRDGTTYPKIYLDTFLNLYEKCKKPENFGYCGSVPFSATTNHNLSFTELNKFRNEFIHFTPKGWSLETLGLPSLVKDVLALIEFFGWHSLAILWYEEELRVRAQIACDSISQTMIELEK